MFTASRSYLRLVVAEVVDLTGAVVTNLSRIEAADEELRLGRVLSACGETRRRINGPDDGPPTIRRSLG